MSWVIPGEPIRVEIEGRDVFIKALDPSERRAFVAQIIDIQEDLSIEDQAEKYASVLAEYVVSIADVADVARELRYQNIRTLRDIAMAIRMSGLTLATRKNSQPSSGGLPPANASAVQTATEAP